MESVVNIIVKYLQKCLKYRSYHINFIMPDNSGLNRMIHNVKNILSYDVVYSLSVYDYQKVYQVYIALLYLSYNNFDACAVENNITETYVKYKSITNDHACVKYTHNEYIDILIALCNLIMEDVDIPANIEHVDVPLLINPIDDLTPFQPGDNHTTLLLKIDINNDSMIIDQSIYEIINGISRGSDRNDNEMKLTVPADVIVERFKQFVNEVSK